MFRCRNFHKAIVMTAMVILLCLVCLTGATYALFVSDPDAGTIGIVATAGEIKVDIIDPDSGDTLVGSALKFQTTSANQSVSFEPGAVFFTQPFRIKNEGSISINYRLSVSVKNEEERKELEDAFDLWIVTDPHDLENAQPMTKFIGHLDTQKNSESTEYYLLIKMKESAGNEYQNKQYNGIGVTVYAVQGNVDVEE